MKGYVPMCPNRAQTVPKGTRLIYVPMCPHSYRSGHTGHSKATASRNGSECPK